jgi:tetratricopeptide (TPR) repeat protein
MHRGQVLFAIAEYSRAVRDDGRCFPALLELAEIRSRLGDYTEAERLYGRALQLEAAADEALTKRAAMFGQRGHTEQALADLRTYVQRRPDAVDRIQRLAAFYVDLKAWAAALASFRRVLALLVAQGGSESSVEHARLQVRALRVLAAETDPVGAGANDAGWVRAAMARLQGLRQGARQLAP